MSTEVTTQAQATGWTPDDATFGARLALVRQRMGWGNIAKAAKECGVPTDSWRNWEVDGREPHRRVTIAMTIATRTGCDYLWLVHGPDRGTIRTTAYDTGPRVLPRRHGLTPVHPSSIGHLGTVRPVRQTRPIVGVDLRPQTRVSM